jgi:hypothetical protein
MQPADIYIGLRTQLLQTDPHAVGLEPTPELPNVWGVMMEFRAANTAGTLVSLADGTTSLYFSTGGGILGGGGHPDVAAASVLLVALAERCFSRMAPASEFPLPDEGRVRFYVLTYSGTFTADVDAQELIGGRHEFSPLHLAASEVIAQVRIVAPEEKP